MGKSRENDMHWASLMIVEVSLEEVSRSDSPVGAVLSNHSFHAGQLHVTQVKLPIETESFQV